MSLPHVNYKRHRFPPRIIAHAVWHISDFRSACERGVVVSYETVRRWAIKFGADYARRLKRKPPSRRCNIWHLDEVVITINGEKRWLWRAVDQEGYVLDEIVQARPQHKRSEAFADAATTKARRFSQTHDHRQARTLRRRKADRYAGHRTSLPQRAEQSSGKFSRSAPKTRTDDAGISILGRSSALCIDLFRRPKPLRSTSLEPHCLRHPPASPPSDGGVEICCSRERLKSSRTANTDRPNVNVTTPFATISSGGGATSSPPSDLVDMAQQIGGILVDAERTCVSKFVKTITAAQ